MRAAVRGPPLCVGRGLLGLFGEPSTCGLVVGERDPIPQNDRGDTPPAGEQAVLLDLPDFGAGGGRRVALPSLWPVGPRNELEEVGGAARGAAARMANTGRLRSNDCTGIGAKTACNGGGI